MEQKEKSPKSVAYYAVLHLPTASYVCRTNDSVPFSSKGYKLLLFRSKEKARKGLKLTNKYQRVFTNSGDILPNNVRDSWHHFEPVHAFTLITFPNKDRILRLYIPIQLKSILTVSDLDYFEHHPERIKHENHS